jgi:large subunit ribosomal protein L35
MKTHKGAQKRFGVTGSGKVVRVKAWRGHHLDIKPSSRTRRYDGKVVVDGTSGAQIKGLLPYIKKQA